MTVKDISAPALPPGFARRGWRRVTRDDMGAAAAVPTMLSPKERNFYLWLAETWATGSGAIVDLGCLAGGSTAYLAQGRARAGRQTPIHAYDRFTASDHVKETLFYPAGIPTFTGHDILGLAQTLLAPFTPAVALHRGDIAEQLWQGGPIELLCIDAAKTERTADRIAEIFFPHLIPGRSIVVHQDFLHWKVPWIPAQMEWLSQCFQPVAVVPRNTVAYLCTRVPAPEELRRARIADHRDHELQAGLLSAAARLASWDVAARIAQQKLALDLNPGARMAKRFHVRP